MKFLFSIQGAEYVSATGSLVFAKDMVPINNCCNKKCFLNYSSDVQQQFHDKFWKLGDYGKQNIFLSTLMKCTDSDNVEGIQRLRLLKWKYYFSTNTENGLICKDFLLKVLSLGKGRLATVQKKMLADEDFNDLRGGQVNQTLKLTDEVKKLINLHCQSMPHQKSHYCRESTSLNYILDPEISMTKMHSEFLKYYTQKTGKTLILDESTYRKYFNYHVNFSFKLPRTDVCNECYLQSLQTEESEEQLKHKENVKEYQALRKKLLSEKNVLACEFDYAQNLPLPKIPVSEQFYKRKLWLYLFNVHVFSSNNSYMFPFLEGTAKKGANTVCSFLKYVVEREFNESNCSKIVLFSDAASGQNRNYTVLSFLLILSAYLNVKIEHIFPVRGHSYCQCDRNFGMYSKKKKKTEVIETTKKYVEIIKESRNPPFIIVESAERFLCNFEVSLKENVKIPKAMKISKACVIHYFPNGTVQLFDNYKSQNCHKFSIKSKIKLENMENIRPPTVGITKAKFNDVSSLLKYISTEGQQFFNDYFLSIARDNEVDDSDLSEEE